MGVEANLGAAKREVYGGGAHPRDRGEEALDEPGAAGAAHAFDGEGDGGGDRAVVAAAAGACAAVVIGAAPQEGRLDLRHPPCVQHHPVAGVGGGRALCVGVGAQSVPGIETGVRDGLDGGTTGIAAYPYSLARQLDPG